MKCEFTILLYLFPEFFFYIWIQLITSAYFDGLKLSFSETFKKGYIIRSVVVAIQNNFPSMFHKNNFSHCEVTRKQYTFCPQHLILS